MNSKEFLIKPEFVITTLPTKWKLITFFGFALVLTGLFSPVIRQADGVANTTNEINRVLSKDANH